MLKLLELRADPCAITHDGWHPLHCAARWGKAGALWALLQNGAEINAQTNGGQTALHLAATLADAESTGAEPPKVEQERPSASSKGRTVLKILLCAAGSDSTLLNDQGETAAELARRRSGNDDLFRLADPCLGLGPLPPPPRQQPAKP